MSDGGPSRGADSGDGVSGTKKGGAGGGALSGEGEAGRGDAGDSEPDAGAGMLPDDDENTGSAIPDGGTGEPQDRCPEDPDKTDPGDCGCGMPDVDTLAHLARP